MSSVILRNLKENDVSISNGFPEVHKRGIHTDRHTDSHKDTQIQIHRHTQTRDDSIRRNAIRLKIVISFPISEILSNKLIVDLNSLLNII